MTASEEPVSYIPPRRKLWRYLFLLLICGLGLYVFLPQFARIEHALEVALTLRLPFVVLSLGAQILSYLGSGYLLRAVVRLVAKPISVVEGALVTLGANSVGTLGGGVLGTTGMTYLWLRQRDVSSGAAGLGAWIPIFLNDAALALVSLLGLVTLILFNKFSSKLLLAFVLAIAILASSLGAFFWSLTHREGLMQFATVIVNFSSRLRRKPIDGQATEIAVGRLLAAWDALLQGGWKRPAIGAVLNTGFDMLTLTLLFSSAGYGVSFFLLVAGYGVPQLLGKLTVILGGVGIVETAMVGLYSSLGVPTPIAIVVVLVYRLISFWLPTLIGVALVPYLGYRNDGASATS